MRSSPRNGSRRPSRRSSPPATRQNLPPAGLWVLARRLAITSGAGGPVAAAMRALARHVVAEVGGGCRGGGGAERTALARQLRLLEVLLRAGAMSEQGLTPVRGDAQALLADGGAPLPLRSEAWCAHAAACCCRPDGGDGAGVTAAAASDLRVAFRYAAKHLAVLPEMGVRVGAALARAPGPLLDGAENVLEGLCSVGWPLRVCGLTAAAAALQRTGTPSPIGSLARAACAAFRIDGDDGCGAVGGWAEAPIDARVLGAKRRRLLVHLVNLPTARGDEEAADPEFADLCLAARGRIDEMLARRQRA